MSTEAEEKKDDASTSGIAANIITVDNYINGTFVTPTTGSYMPILSPFTSGTVGSVAVSAKADVDAAVSAASSNSTQFYPVAAAGRVARDEHGGGALTWHTRGNSQYAHIDAPASWGAAQETCVSLGGNLA